MASLAETPMSCGIRILHGLCEDQQTFRESDKPAPKVILLEAFNADNDIDGGLDWYSGLPKKTSDITFGLVLFSDSIRRGNGKRLADFIKKNKLGDVVPSTIIINPNTHRKIQMWTWYLDRAALIAWLKANKGAKDEYDEDDEDWEEPEQPRVYGQLRNRDGQIIA